MLTTQSLPTQQSGDLLVVALVVAAHEVPDVLEGGIVLKLIFLYEALALAVEILLTLPKYERVLGVTCFTDCGPMSGHLKPDVRVLFVQSHTVQLTSDITATVLLFCEALTSVVRREVGKRGVHAGCTGATVNGRARGAKQGGGGRAQGAGLGRSGWRHVRVITVHLSDSQTTQAVALHTHCYLVCNITEHNNGTLAYVTGVHCHAQHN